MRVPQIPVEYLLLLHMPKAGDFPITPYLYDLILLLLQPLSLLLPCLHFKLYLF